MAKHIKTTLTRIDREDKAVLEAYARKHNMTRVAALSKAIRETCKRSN